MKPGLKTTEFWLALAAIVLVSLPQAFGDDNSWVKLAGIVGAALIAAGYIFGRSMVKVNEDI